MVKKQGRVDYIGRHDNFIYHQSGLAIIHIDFEFIVMEFSMALIPLP